MLGIDTPSHSTDTQTGTGSQDSFQEDTDSDSYNRQAEDRRHREEHEVGNSKLDLILVQQFQGKVLLFLFLMQHQCSIGDPELITDVFNTHNRPYRKMSTIVLLK